MIRVNLGERSYDIAVVSGQPGFGDFAAARVTGRKALIVVDENVRGHAERIDQKLLASGFSATTTVVPSGESTKSLARLAGLLEQLAALPADRRTAVVAIGGGVVGDLAGFAAATYNRGLPLLMVPTTLLAMVDSSVGGKVGINLPQGKNLVGAFHQPAGVWIDTAMLDTLPDREYQSGLAEVVKYGVILDAAFFEWLESNVDAILRRDADTVRHLVARSCELKARVVESDEQELTGLRAKLNYGHTFAHAFETVGGYGTWLHGEAVAAGMVCASRLAEALSMIPPEVTVRQIDLLKKFGLPVTPPRNDPAAWLDAMRRDKKSVAGRLRFVLPTRLGEVVAGVEVDEATVSRLLVDDGRSRLH